MEKYIHLHEILTNVNINVPTKLWRNSIPVFPRI